MSSVREALIAFADDFEKAVRSIGDLNVRLADTERDLQETRLAWAAAADDRDAYSSQLSSAKEEVERLKGTTRVIDGKFAVRGGVIVKMSSGEVVPEDEPLVLMRGRDHLMVATLMHYRNLCRLDGCNDYQLGLVDALIEKFTRYASDPSRMKQPGVTRGAAWNPGAAPSPEGKAQGTGEIIREELNRG